MFYSEQEDVVEESADLSTDESNDESYEQDDTASESEGTETVEETVERKPETPEQRIARLKRQLEREERKLGIESEKGNKESRKESSKEEVGSDVADRLDRSDLRFEGIKDRNEQNIVIEYARYKGMDVLDALNSPAVKAELKEYRNKAATPSPSRRSGQGQRDEVAYWAERAEKGQLAPSPDMRKKVMKYLADNKR